MRGLPGIVAAALQGRVPAFDYQESTIAYMANLSVFGLQLGSHDPPPNPHFSRSKTHLILRCANTQNLVRVLGMDHIFASPGAPEILQKSNKNRS